MAEADLVLDPSIRNWVLIPLSVVMILIGVLRHQVTSLLFRRQTPDLKALRRWQAALRASCLRKGAQYVPMESFLTRRCYYTNEENGVLLVLRGKVKSYFDQLNDPDILTKMINGHLSMSIPQMLIFTWVNCFFYGFVAAKLPFPLTERFRQMLQTGLYLNTVDVTYVSSRSWYFLNLFGLRGLFSLVLGEESASESNYAMQKSSFGIDPATNLSTEKDNLDAIQHEWILPKCEHHTRAVLKKLII